MHYSYSLVVHPGNNRASFAFVPLAMASGILTRCQIFFPAGCGYKICAVVLSKSNQILPTNADGYYALDSGVVDATLRYDLDKYGNFLYLVAWSIDCNYDHTIYCHMDVQEPGEMTIEQIVATNNSLIDRLISVIRSML